jgi:hypothetical protein
MYKLLLLIAVLLFSGGFISSQTYYEATYECTLAVNAKAGRPQDSLQMGIPLQSVIEYEVKASDKYVHVTGYLKERPGFAGAAINITSSKTEVIFDLQRSLVYYPDEKKYQLLHWYQFSKTCDSTAQTAVKYLAGKDSSMQVTVSNSIPWFVSPAVFFDPKHVCGGTKGIKTPTLSIVLVGNIRKKAGTLNYNSYFNEIDAKSLKSTYTFF